MTNKFPIFYYSTGNLKDRKSELTRALGQYARHYDYIKIGITCDPERRWIEHQNERKRFSDSWLKMVVIYETSSRKYVNEAERLLINHTKTANYNIEKWNDVGGGGGNYSEEADKYYLYLLLDKDYR
jgi:predicted GIY-YIG superfamily endonuclease